MRETDINVRHFSWRLSVIAALLAFVVFISLVICQADTALFAYLFLVGPILVLVSILLMAYIIMGKRLKHVTLLSALAVISST